MPDLERNAFPGHPGFRESEESEFIQNYFPGGVGDKTTLHCTTSHLPSEKDLIDSELDEFLKEGLLPGVQQAEEIEEYRDIVKVQTNVAPLKKRQAQKKRKKKDSVVSRPLKQEEREKVAKVKRTELEKAGKEAGLNKSLLAFTEMCVFAGQLNKSLNSLNFYRMRKGEFPRVTDVAIFNLLLHGFASKV